MATPPESSSSSRSSSNVEPVSLPSSQRLTPPDTLPAKSPSPSVTAAQESPQFTLDYNPDPDYSVDITAENDDQPYTASVGEVIAEEGAPPLAPYQAPKALLQAAQTPTLLIAIASTFVVVVGLALNSFWLTLAGSLVALIVSLRLAIPTIVAILSDLSPEQQALVIAMPGLTLGIVGIMQTSGLNRQLLIWGRGIRWDVVGALGDFLGALGQIFIAVLALYVAWRQFIISRDLTTQQNLITQQQTIDAYFQGISELVLDEEGLLEDWPQERIIAEARTAAILSSVDSAGKAKVLRFLSRSKLLTPLARDRRLGRPILDGSGGYAEDRLEGTRVIDVGVMLAASNLASNDLRWVDLSDTNLIRADLSGCNLVRANFGRTILCDANFSTADIMGARFFYGPLETASPRTRVDTPNYETGEFTGAVVEGANFSMVQRMSETQRCYCCAWGGDKTRATIPGGCGDIPNLLGR